MEVSTIDVTGVSPMPASVVDGGDSRQPIHRRPAGLTITVEKLDRAMAAIQSRIETLRQERVDLGLVRGELVRMEAITGKVQETK